MNCRRDRVQKSLVRIGRKIDGNSRFRHDGADYLDIEQDLAIGAVIYQGTPTKVAQGVLAMPVQSTQLFRRIATDSIVSEQIAPIKNGPTPPSGQNAKSLG